MSECEKLIQEILMLDGDTYMGIDDPSFLSSMTEAQLQAYLAEMQRELGLEEGPTMPEGMVDHEAEDRQAYDAERNERPGY